MRISVNFNIYFPPSPFTAFVRRGQRTAQMHPQRHAVSHHPRSARAPTCPLHPALSSPHFLSCQEQLCRFPREGASAVSFLHPTHLARYPVSEPFLSVLSCFPRPFGKCSGSCNGKDLERVPQPGLAPTVEELPCPSLKSLQTELGAHACQFATWKYPLTEVVSLPAGSWLSQCLLVFLHHTFFL